MADDFKNDPEYLKVRDQLDTTRKSSRHWLTTNLGSVLVAAALIGGALLELGALGVEVGTLGLGTPVALAMAAVGAGFFGLALYSKHKYINASKDSAMAEAEATAQRTGYYVGKAIQQQKQQEFYADVGTTTKFQDMVNAQRGRGQNVVTH